MIEKDARKVDLEKRKLLEKIFGANNIGNCYQCGACVGDCPSARFHSGYNPRLIMLKALMGDYDELVSHESDIWLCSNCYNCYERCPQDVRPVEVITALKNIAVKKGSANEEINDVVKRILETGRSVPVMGSTNKLREKLGLKPLNKIDVTEINKLIKGDPGDEL